MKCHWLRWPAQFGAIALIGFTTIAAQADETPATDQPPANVEAEVAPAQDENDQVMPCPLYWLGLDVLPPTPAMRAQLKLAEGEGIFVEHVVEVSPAAKAGVKQYDLLLAADNAKLGELSSLVKVLLQCEGKPIKLELIRGGEKKTIEVTPEKRPATVAPLLDRVNLLQGDQHAAWQRIRDHLAHAGAPVRMHFFHPGMLLPGATTTQAFPDDLHVTIHKHGNKPSEIVVERDQEKWTVTEDKLAELPEDVRVHVESMLGHGAAAAEMQLDSDESFNVPLPPPAGATHPRVERQLDEMNRRLEHLRKEMEALRKAPADQAEDVEE